MAKKDMVTLLEQLRHAAGGLIRAENAFVNVTNDETLTKLQAEFDAAQAQYASTVTPGRLLEVVSLCEVAAEYKFLSEMDTCDMSDAELYDEHEPDVKRAREKLFRFFNKPVPSSASGAGEERG